MDGNPPGLFVTGTDTGVGKTYVAALIAQSLLQAGCRVGVYKPVASGCTLLPPYVGPHSPDALALWEAAGRPGELHEVCPQRFLAPLAPHLAAKAEERIVDRDLLRQGLQYWQQRSEIVVVEGAGGLMSPISDDDYVADLACEFGYPLVVVAPNRVGVINQTLQTLLAAQTFRIGIPLAGIVLNDNCLDDDDPSRESNAAELTRHCRAPLLARVAYQATNFAEPCDWQSIANAR